ncbi:MAG: hypothetical protein KC416_16440, partial [Myxococcales bacterium]|nr:hypothetical protein [Myxococcales bacterium]
MAIRWVQGNTKGSGRIQRDLGWPVTSTGQVIQADGPYLLWHTVGPLGSWTSVFDARRGGASLWEGSIDPAGDPGERRSFAFSEVTTPSGPRLALGVLREDLHPCGDPAYLHDRRLWDRRARRWEIDRANPIDDAPVTTDSTRTGARTPSPTRPLPILSDEASLPAPFRVTHGPGSPSTKTDLWDPGQGFANTHWDPGTDVASNGIAAVYLEWEGATDRAVVLLQFDDGNGVYIDPSGSRDGHGWIHLQEPRRSKCMTVHGDHVRIRLIQPFGEMDTKEGRRRLIEAMAQPGSDGATAARLL